MIITNHHNLPQAMYEAICKANSYCPTARDIRVTSLIGPPHLRRLLVQHWDEIEQDATELMWAFYGTMNHALLEGQLNLNQLSEERLWVKIGDVNITGQFDSYSDGIINDYKFPSIWSLLFGLKQEWIYQLNIYSWMLRKEGFPVRKAYIHVFPRDWRKGEAMKGGDYPQVPYVRIEVPLMPDAEVEAYVNQRIKLHIAEEVPECTPEEKWERPTTWAVMKHGRKSALRVCDSMEQAYRYAKQKDLVKFGTFEVFGLKDNYSIVKRPGGCIRCENYCPVRQFC